MLRGVEAVRDPETGNGTVCQYCHGDGWSVHHYCLPNNKLLSHTVIECVHTKEDICPW